jgi:hypothetical protein
MSRGTPTNRAPRNTPAAAPGLTAPPLAPACPFLRLTPCCPKLSVNGSYSQQPRTRGRRKEEKESRRGGEAVYAARGEEGIDRSCLGLGYGAGRRRNRVEAVAAGSEQPLRRGGRHEALSGRRRGGGVRVVRERKSMGAG